MTEQRTLLEDLKTLVEMGGCPLVDANDADFLTGWIDTAMLLLEKVQPEFASQAAILRQAMETRHATTRLVCEYFTKPQL